MIRKKQIKYLKLILISPWLERFIGFLYLIALPTLVFNFLYSGNWNLTKLSAYDIHSQIKQTFNEKALQNISSPQEFLIYIEEQILNNLYNINISLEIPYFIPLGSVRLKKYSIDASHCQYITNSNISYNCSGVCPSEAIIQLLNNNTDCFRYYKKDLAPVINTTMATTSNSSYAFDFFVNPLRGKYSSYDLIYDGQNIDFNLLQFNDPSSVSGYKGSINTFISDVNTRFLIVMFNVYSVYGNNYINVICGIEMTQYFSQLNYMFLPTTFNKYDDQNNFTFSIYVIFAISIILSILKLIYEMNLKFRLFVHLSQLLYDLNNLMIFIFYTFYLSASKIIVFNDNMYHDYSPVIAIKSYLILMLTFAVYCYPYRLISFLSWFKKCSKHIVVYMNILYRMLPGIIITSFLFSMFLFSYSILLYVVYNEYMKDYSTFFSSIINLFNIFSTIQSFHNNDNFNQNLLLSPMHIFFFIMILVSIFFILFFTLATYFYLFKESSKCEIKKEQNEVIEKIEEISNKFDKLIADKSENSPLRDENKIKRQLIWLSLTGNNTIYSTVTGNTGDRNKRHKVLLFNSSSQIISFLKYLFAIKPKIQFKNLNLRFGILIECMIDTHSITKSLKDNDIEQVDNLLDWLNFAGCNIPIAFYTTSILDRNYRMNINNIYWNISFINVIEDVKEFIDDNKDEANESAGFKLYPLNKDSQEFNTNAVIRKLDTSQSIKSKSTHNGQGIFKGKSFDITSALKKRPTFIQVSPGDFSKSISVRREIIKNVTSKNDQVIEENSHDSDDSFKLH